MLQNRRIAAFAVAALALLSANFSPAQISSGVNGQPVIATGASTGTSSSAYVDAYVVTSSYTPANDVCLRIQYVYNSVLASGSSATVDARGFTINNAPTGGWVCSVNPFSTTAGTGLVGKAGKLLLGYIDIPAQVTWVIPTRTIVEGLGANGTGLAGANTMIHAASSFSAGLGSTTAVVQMGLGGTSTNTAAVSFGIQIRNLSVDCNATLSGNGATVGVLNNNAEEMSLLYNVQIFDCPLIGLHVTTNNPYSAGVGAVNSGPYQDVSINFTNTCGACGSTTIALQADGATGSSTTVQGRSIRGFDNFTVSGNNVSGTKPTLIYVYGVSTAITNSHVEYCSGVCVQIGETGASPTYSTEGVRVSDVTVGVNNGGYDLEIAAGTSTYPNGNILVENLNHETTANSNTLKDLVTGNVAGDNYLGWYFLGAGATPTVFTSSTSLTNSGTAYALKVSGNADITGSLAKGSGSFKIDHPLDPAHQYLFHSFVESPDMMNIYNGSVTTDKHGVATVTLPNYFEALNQDFRYQLTPMGQSAQAYVAEKVKGNRFVIKTSKPGVEVSWQVTGIRHDAFANEHRIKVEEQKPESLRNR